MMASSPSENDAAAAAIAGRRQQDQEEEEDDDDEEEEEQALPMWMEGDSLGVWRCLFSLDPHSNEWVADPNPSPSLPPSHFTSYTREPNHTKHAAPPCQSELDIVPEVLALAQVTHDDVSQAGRQAGRQAGKQALGSGTGWDGMGRDGIRGFYGSVGGPCCACMCFLLGRSTTTHRSDRPNPPPPPPPFVQVLFDLGCGDGRVCIEAAKATGARAVGEWVGRVVTAHGSNEQAHRASS